MLTAMLGGRNAVDLDGVEGLAPHSEEALFARMRTEFDDHGVHTGYLLTAVSTTVLTIDPAFRELLAAVKPRVDPDRRLNSGGLGFATGVPHG
jgi:hypothetical protein